MDRNKRSGVLPTVALIHAPGALKAEVQAIWEGVISEAAFRRISINRVLINPTEDELHPLEDRQMPFQMILVWGLAAETSLSAMVNQYCTKLLVKYLLALDKTHLTQHRLKPPPCGLGGNGNLLVCPRRRLRITYFLAGFFHGPAPYGYEKVPVIASRQKWSNKTSRQGPFRLELGDPMAIEVTQCIFDLFENDKMSRSQILDSLITQHVEPPPGSNRWNHGRITSILLDPVYIGANRYCDLVCHDVFPPIIDQVQFFKVQSLLSNQATELRFGDTVNTGKIEQEVL